MKRKDQDKPGIAVALRYDGHGAPRVTAKGRGCVAENILELARAHDIPLQEDPALAELLAKVDLGDEIPRALYHAVAEVIAFAYLLSGKAAPNRQGE
ncbi:MAG: EscU/YscU/HrcU family type III secretion system export apparatus switch protein [Gammaproteobacteria bacterium]